VHHIENQSAVAFHRKNKEDFALLDRLTGCRQNIQEFTSLQKAVCYQHVCFSSILVSTDF